MADAAPAVAQRRAADADSAGPGRAVLQAFYAASRLGALWGFESKLADEALTHLDAVVRASASAHGEVTLRFADDLVYVNESRLRVDFSGYLAFKHLNDRVVRRGVGEITISLSASRRDVVRLLTVLEARVEGTASADEVFEDTREELQAAGAVGVSVGPRLQTDGSRGHLGPTDVRQAAIQAYFRLLFVARRAISAAAEGKVFNARRCKRAVHEVVDVLERGEHLILAMTQVKNYHGYGPCHAANVCVLSCAAALRSGLGKLKVADLGVAALVHEIHPPDSSRTDDAGLRERDRHSARTILSNLGFSDGALRAVLAARDLHAPASSSHGVEAPLTQRIVRAACFLDSQTTPAGDDDPARPFREVLQTMSRDPQRFDRTVVRLLRAAMGIHPFGTIVRLDTGERAVVRGRNPHFDQPARPVVRVIEDAAGNAVDEGETIDLSKWDRERNRFVHSIVEAVPACEVFDRPADFVRVL